MTSFHKFYQVVFILIFMIFLKVYGSAIKLCVVYV